MTADTILVLVGARTPIGSFGGICKDVPGLELGATAAKRAFRARACTPARSRRRSWGASARSARTRTTLVAPPSRRGFRGRAVHRQPALRLEARGSLVGAKG
jgi:hypothetical protein